MPAAAVIPAPIAYIKVVAVKRLVVELLASRSMSRGSGCVVTWRRLSWWKAFLPFIGLVS